MTTQRAPALDPDPLDGFRLSNREVLLTSGRPDPSVPAATVTAGNTERAEEEETDHVNEDSMHSFPASDPPGWITMWAGTPTTNEGRGEEVV
jgi:hypothetical protein